MADNTPNLVLEHLRHIRGSVDRIEQDVGDLKHRVSSHEEITDQILMMLGALGKRFDRTEERLGRIERRLDLVEA